MSFWYLASPYSKYPGGHDKAFDIITENAALLVGAGIVILSPIVHSHPIALKMAPELNTYDTWLPQDLEFVKAAKGLIVCMMDTWQISHGVQWEIEQFDKLEKPIIYMVPGIVPTEVF